MNRRHDRNPEINRPLGLAILHAEASVLRHASFGNVELAHDLDARDDRRMMLFGNWRHGLSKHAVNAELDTDRIVLRLDMDITGAPLKGRKNRGIHKPDDRAHVALRRQLVDRDAFVAAFLFMNYGESEAFASIFQNAFRLFGLLEDFADLREGGNFGDDALAQQQADFIDHHQLAGIGNSNRQTSVSSFLKRNKVVPEHQVRRNFRKQIVVQLEIMQVYELATIPSRNILGVLKVGSMGAG